MPYPDVGAYENVGKDSVADDDGGGAVDAGGLFDRIGMTVMVLAIVIVDVTLAESEAGVVDAAGKEVAVIKHFQWQSAISLQA